MIDPSGDLALSDPTADSHETPRPQDKPKPPPLPLSQPDRRATSARLRTGAMFLIPMVLLFLLYLRVAATAALNSDGANNVLQAWDILHGHVLLPGWVIGDATYYTFELPIYALTELMVGVSPEVVRLGDTIVYFLVASAAALLACRGDRGQVLSKRTIAVRCGIVVSFMTVPLAVSTIQVMLNSPDHIGTCAILLGAIFLAGAAGQGESRRNKYLPIWLGVVLTLGQLGDATVLYVGTVPILLISCYRICEQRRIFAADGAIALAAGLSYFAAPLIRTISRDLGGYTMIPPLTKLAPMSQWPGNALITLHNLGAIFGITPAPSQAVPHSAAMLSMALGWLAALGTVIGFALVVRRWRTAGRGAQVLCLAILVDIGSYTVSLLPNPSNAREVVFVLPAGSVLAAWACRDRLASRVFTRRWATALIAVVLVATAFVPLAQTAARPVATSRDIVLSQWLKAHDLKYGIAGYWDSSSISVNSGNAVQVRAVWLYRGRFLAYDWESKADWFDPALNNAQFFITDPINLVNEITPTEVEAVYGQPVAEYTVAERVILVYRANLLTKVEPLLPGAG